MSIEEMDYEIKNFIEEYRGTAIGDSIYNKRCNTNDTDFDRIQDIYNEVINFWKELNTMKEKKTVQKSIRMTPRVDNYVNSFPGEGFNEKFENLVLFVMEHENNIQKNIGNANQHLISLNNLIENKE